MALRPRSVRGVARELTWLAAHVALYPTGIVRDRLRGADSGYSLQGLPPRRRGLVVSDVEAAATPILLVHGMVDNRSVFAVLGRALRRRGFGRVVSVNYSVFTADVRTAAVQLAHEVERLVDESGYERIHMVSHSLGGVIARYYVQRLGGDERVHTLVTIGSPHSGTRVANLVPHPLCRQLRPGSDLVRELGTPARGCRTRFVAFYGDIDQIVVPRGHARIDHPDLTARNVLVPGCGHMSLPFAGRVGHEVCSMLAQLDHDGWALDATVTDLQRPVSRRAARRARTGVPSEEEDVAPVPVP